MVQQFYIDQPHSLRELVHNRLAGNPFVISRSLTINVNEDEVTLRGYVPTYYQKQLAQESIRNIEGVRTIHNELEVIDSPM